MTIPRLVFVVGSVAAIVGGVATIAVLLRMPGWAYPPTALVLGAGVVGLGVVAADGSTSPGQRDVGWRAVLLGTAVVLVSGVTIGVALSVPTAEPSDRPGADVVAEATDTVRALYSVPADAGSRPRRYAYLMNRLTTPLRSDSTGIVPTPVPLPDVPGAASQLEVQRVGVARADATTARLLLFGVVRVRVPGRSPAEVSAPIARSVVLRRVDATWRVADVYPVGPGG